MRDPAEEYAPVLRVDKCLYKDGFLNEVLITNGEKKLSSLMLDN